MGNICFRSNIQTIKVASSHSNGSNSKPRLQPLPKKTISRSSLPPPPPPPSEPPSPTGTPTYENDIHQVHARLTPPTVPRLPPPPTRLLPVTPPRKPARKSKPKSKNDKTENNENNFIRIQDAEDLTPIVPFEQPEETQSSRNKPVRDETGHREPVQLVSSWTRQSPKLTRPGTPAISLSENDGSRISVSNVSVRPGSLVSASIKSNLGLSLMELDDEMDEFSTVRSYDTTEKEEQIKRSLQEFDMTAKTRSSHLGTEQDDPPEVEADADMSDVTFSDVISRQGDNLPSVPKQIHVHLPRELNKEEQEKTRRRQQRKRRRDRMARKKIPQTPRVPKPDDSVSDGFDFRRKSKSRESLASVNSDWSADTFTFRNDILDFGNPDDFNFGSDSHHAYRSYREGSNDSLLSMDTSRLIGSQFGNDDNMYHTKTTRSNADSLQDLNIPDGVPSEMQNSRNSKTKQRLLYSRYQRRPVSETMVGRIAGKPPLPPGALAKVRPMSESNINRSTHNYSRHFAEENVLIDIT